MDDRPNYAIVSPHGVYLFYSAWAMQQVVDPGDKVYKRTGGSAYTHDITDTYKEEKDD